MDIPLKNNSIKTLAFPKISISLIEERDITLATFQIRD